MFAKRYISIFAALILCTSALLAYIPQPGDTLDIQVINKKTSARKLPIPRA